MFIVLVLSCVVLYFLIHGRLIKIMDLNSKTIRTNNDEFKSFARSMLRFYENLINVLSFVLYFVLSIILIYIVLTLISIIVTIVK